MTCQWQMGMLTMRECGMPAGSGCSLCGASLCMMHTVMGQNGPACPRCASMNQGYAQTEDTELAASRDEYYRPYGGAAAYGQPGFFSRSDSSAMNRPAAMPVRRQDEDYDAMET